jgi:hypothetical protein
VRAAHAGAAPRLGGSQKREAPQGLSPMF